MLAESSSKTSKVRKWEWRGFRIASPSLSILVFDLQFSACDIPGFQVYYLLGSCTNATPDSWREIVSVLMAFSPCVYGHLEILTITDTFDLKRSLRVLSTFYQSNASDYIFLVFLHNDHHFIYHLFTNFLLLEQA